jgi:phosphoserine aminotransferase
MKIHNFSGGPAILPEWVYNEAADAIKNYKGTGLSILEISHRSADFNSIIVEAEELLRELLSIPQDYSVLFLAGGASQHFAQIPLNLLNKNREAAYLDSGVWASNAISEARRYGKVRVVASGKDDDYGTVPTDFQVPEDCVYFHYTSNNTIYGTRLVNIPESPVPIVCDMSSDILSTELDVSKFGLIYASAQKNAGIAGVSIIIVQNKLLDKINDDIPNIFNYSVLAANKSLYNTPPVFAIYAALLNLQWLKAQGGLKAIERRNIEKSNLLYEEIDRNSLFQGRVKNIAQRSRMNVTFYASNPEHEKDFLDFAAQRGIAGIKQYQGYGGFRASLYNALPLESVKALVAVMREYENHKKGLTRGSIHQTYA